MVLDPWQQVTIHNLSYYITMVQMLMNVSWSLPKNTISRNLQILMFGAWTVTSQWHPVYLCNFMSSRKCSILSRQCQKLQNHLLTTLIARMFLVAYDNATTASWRSRKCTANQNPPHTTCISTPKMAPSNIRWSDTH